MPAIAQDDLLRVAGAVRDAVRAIPNIAEVSAGRFARIGTFGPRTLVPGIAVHEHHGDVIIDVHVVAFSSASSLPNLADTIRQVTRSTALEHGMDSVQEINVIFEGLRDEESTR